MAVYPTVRVQACDGHMVVAVHSRPGCVADLSLTAWHDAKGHRTARCLGGSDGLAPGT
jgi:hypothetical protein